MKTKLLIMFLMAFILSFAWSMSIAQASPANASQEIFGSNLSEKMLRWVWKHRKDFSRSCLIDEKECVKPGTENIELLKQIYRDMDKTSDEQLQFVSEKKRPDLFKSSLGETHRIAVTSQTAGDVIYFNSDRIIDLTFENMVAIVFHELTHHQGLADDATRLPDKIGVHMAQHVLKNLLRSPYSGNQNLQLESAVYQVPTQESLDWRYLFTNFAYFTDGETLFDINLANFVAEKPCNTEGFEIGAQYSEAPRWKEVENNDGTRSYQLIMLMNNLCYKKKFLVLADYEKAQRNYASSFSLTSNGRLDRDSFIEALSSSMGVYLDYVSTLQLKSLNIAKPQVKPGDTQSISLQVKSFSPLSPKNCQVGIGYQDTPLQAGGIPVVDTPGPCEVRVIGNNLWELRTEFTVSATSASGNYYVRNVFVTGDGGDGTAYLGLPQTNPYVVVNPQNNTALKVLSAKNLVKTKVDKFTDIAVNNSGIFNYGERVNVRFEVRSQNPINVAGLKVYSIQAIKGKLETVWNTAAPESFVDYQIQQKSTTKDSQTQIVEISWLVPKKDQGNPCFGFSLQEVMFESGSSVVSWKAAGPYDFMFIEKSLADMNR